MNGAELIASERQRQITAENYTAAHDDQHTDGALAVVAAALAVNATDASVVDPLERIGGDCRPARHDWWGLVAKYGYDGTKPCQVRALAIAGALIAAEIDRVIRLNEVEAAVE